ncbi:MAG TPA: ABC transporter ATP-binding protein [Candidatus Eremiobacteraceae bacterium]
MTVLDAHELYRFYHNGDEEVLALRGVSLSVKAGETVVVVGPSGSGKSTLLACIAGLDDPDGGVVTVLGKRMTRRPERERAALRAAHVGLVMQSGNLIDGLSVEDNVRFQRALARDRLDRGGVEDLLTFVGLSERRHTRPGELSGGEYARAAFAAALVNEPALLLADEPTGEVDAEAERALLDLLDRRRVAGGSALVVTHSEALTSRADRVIRLHDGRILDG